MNTNMIKDAETVGQKKIDIIIPCDICEHACVCRFQETLFNYAKELNDIKKPLFLHDIKLECQYSKFHSPFANNLR